METKYEDGWENYLELDYFIEWNFWSVTFENNR